MPIIKKDCIYNDYFNKTLFYDKVLTLNVFSKGICLFYEQIPFTLDPKKKQKKRISTRKKQKKFPIVKRIPFHYSLDVIDTYNKIEHIKNDYAFNLLKPKKGFSFPIKEEYFKNKYVVDYDFQQQFYFLKIKKYYLKTFLSVAFKAREHLRYAAKRKFIHMFPLKTFKGKLLIFFRGSFACIKVNHIKSYLNLLVRLPRYKNWLCTSPLIKLLYLCVFSASELSARKLTKRFKVKARRIKVRLRKKFKRAKRRYRLRWVKRKRRAYRKRRFKRRKNAKKRNKLKLKL